jgi:microcystin degradation protein MlrC
MPRRVLLAGLYHETHTFLDQLTDLDDFAVRYEDELESSVGDSSPMGGFYEVAEQYGWQVVPTVDYSAAPSGTVTDDVLESYWGALEPRLQRALNSGLDAIFLVLHGAMTSRSVFDVEGELLARFRGVERARGLPVFGVYDLHANFTTKMAEMANCLVAYRENPHIDARDAAIRAAQLLQRYFESGRLPRMYFLHPPLIWPPTGTGTADEPMKTLEAKARSFEVQSNNLWAVNVNGGFSFADAPHTGVSFSIVTTGAFSEAQAALRELAAAAVELREAGNVLEPPIDTVLPKLRPDPRGPILLVEPSDNIGGGAPGDGTGVLRAFLRYEVQNAAVIINDPQAVQRLIDLEPGKAFTLPIGGKGSRFDAGPVPLEVTLVSKSDGRFILEDPQSHLAAMRGNNIDMGPSAVVRHRGITILLTSRKTPPFDLGQLRSQGIEPTKLDFIGVKAAVAHRRAYDPIAAQSYTVGTPGPCSSDLKSFPFRYVRRPIYPLDDPFASANSPMKEPA